MQTETEIETVPASEGSYSLPFVSHAFYVVCPTGSCGTPLYVNANTVNNDNDIDSDNSTMTMTMTMTMMVMIF